MSNQTNKLTDKINAIEDKLKQLKAQRQLAEKRERQRTREQTRKDDTRRKIVLGALYLKRMKNDDQFKQNILEWLDKNLTENRDRKLFGLPEINQEQSKHQTTEKPQQQEYFGLFDND